MFTQLLTFLFLRSLVYGRDVVTVVEQPFDLQDMLSIAPQGKQTVVYEARYLKALFLKLQMS